MKLVMILMYLATVTLSSQVAKADWDGRHESNQGGGIDLSPPCVDEQWDVPYLLKTVVYSYSASCEEQKPELQRLYHSYPAMDFAVLSVDAWVGGYVRGMEVEHFYRVRRFSTCRGIIGEPSYESDGRHHEDTLFNVDNPNLHDDVSMSFVASAPMTDEEIPAALVEARKACSAVIPHSMKNENEME